MLDIGKRVLIVEDDLGFRNPLSTFLSSHACTVFGADDGEQAMEKILFHEPNLVILDLMLPKINGLKVLERIRKYPDAEIAKTPVLVLSNMTGADEMKKAQELKVDGYFIKSQTSFDDVLKKAQEILFKGKLPKGMEVLDFTQPQ
jgi:two-component system, response regulator